MSKYPIINSKKAKKLIEESSNPFYVYLLFKPKSTIPFYVGKGSGHRAFEHYKRCNAHTTIKDYILRKLKKKQIEPLYCIPYFFNKEEEAFEKEANLIKRYGTLKEGGILSNIDLGDLANSSSYRFSILIKKFRQIHGDKYNYSKSIYKGISYPIEILCREHGPFWKTPSKHKNAKQGCPHCSMDLKSDFFRKPLQDFINQSNKEHKFKYDYSKVTYVNCWSLVEIICPVHGPFWKTPDKHLRKNGKAQGCPSCRDFYAKGVVQTDSDYKFIRYFRAEDLETATGIPLYNLNSVYKYCSLDESFMDYKWWYHNEYRYYINSNNIVVKGFK